MRRLARTLTKEKALNQSLGSLDLEELKEAASNGEAGLVRLATHAENPLLSECCTRQGLEWNSGR